MRANEIAISRATVVGAVFALVAACAGWATAAPLPEQDSFYAEPADLAEPANGTVLASRAIEAESFLHPLPADAWQVQSGGCDFFQNILQLLSMGSSSLSSSLTAP
ncbi:hypothetical protein ACWZHB_09020 [Nocardia sp. FBN12]|uniref:hypothetical protein n=1 Tax=Nocardia sp. FBN12 TaxID=3419766 RepID=UPI003D010D19